MLKAARAVMRDLASTLVVSWVVVEHLGGVGRRALVGQGGGEGGGDVTAGEGGPGWECTLWGGLSPPVRLCHL